MALPIENVEFKRRLAWTTAARLAFQLVLLGIFFALRWRSGFETQSFTLSLGLLATGLALVVNALSAVALKADKALAAVAFVQIVGDQIILTLLAYLSGGATSGATSLYGLACIVGAILEGYRGAIVAGVSAIVAYSLMLSGLSLGWLSPPPDQPIEAYEIHSRELFYAALLNGMGILVVVLLSGLLVERLRVTGGRLAEAQARAERAERLALLGEIAAGLAHEIRNPLGAISGSVEMIRLSPQLEEDDRHLCDIVSREANRLNELVSDMLELSRRRPPEKILVDLSILSAQVAALANAGNAELSVETELEQGVTALVDSAQIRQLLWNLLRNAGQASEEGKPVFLRLRNRSDAIQLEVEDRGTGLSEEAKKHLFDAFYTSRAKGTGIGLAVVSRIAEEHAIQIEVESSLGEGTIFRLLIPIGIESSREEPRKWTLRPPGGEEASS